MAKKSDSGSKEVETTGHEWDGVQELNMPLPRWWVWVFYITIIWAIGYWILYPAWPLVSSHTTGVLGYTQRGQVAEEMARAQEEQAEFREKIAESELADIQNDPVLLSFALAGGAAAFGDNCAPCHGRGAQGAIGYPNLRDDAWLWGGSLDAIHHTIKYGIRAEHESTRNSAMPAFGKLGMLNSEQISDVSEYVMSLSGNEGDDEAAARGQELYNTSCAACHGPEGQGNQMLGAPNLADELWLYGGDKATIMETIANSRAGVMPAFEGRLDPSAIKELVIYVHSLGGGQ